MACSEIPGVYSLGEGEWIFYIIDRPMGDGGKLPLVMMFHGFTGTHIEAGRLYTDLARAICEAGYVVFRFDYRNHGDSSGPFEDFRLSRALEDAETMVKYALGLDYVDTGRVAFIGLSMGGYVALRTFEKFRQNVKTLILMAPAIVFGPLRMNISEDGYAYFGAFRLKGDSLKESSGQSAADIAEKVDVPIMIVHSMDDAAVPIQESIMFLQFVRTSDKKLLYFERSGHVFEDYKVRVRIRQEVIDWLKARV